jgi:hypothetical protein
MASAIIEEQRTSMADGTTYSAIIYLEISYCQTGKHGPISESNTDYHHFQGESERELLKFFYLEVVKNCYLMPEGIIF